VDRVKWFRELSLKAAKLHTFAWCVKRQAVVMVRNLDADECVACKAFVLNDGMCDPL